MNAEEIAKRGIDYQNSGDMPNAIKYFKKSIQLDPKNTIAQYSLAVICFNEAEYQKALEHVNCAISGNENVGFFFQLRAKLKYQLGSLDEAIMDEQRATYIDKNINIDRHQNDIFDIIQKQPASFFIDESIFSKLESLVDLCENLVLRNRIEEAIYMYRRYINTKKSDRFVAYFNLAAIYSRIGEDHSARGCLVEVIKITPNFLPAYLNLGTVLEKLELTSEALEIWEKGNQLSQINALEEIETRIKFLTNLGRLHEILRNYASAEAYLYEILNLDGEQEGVLQHWIHLRQKQCKWPIITNDKFCQKPLEEMVSPLSALSMTDSPKIQLACSEKFAKERIKQYSRRVPKHFNYNHERIRIGYASADLSMHAVSLLTVEMFELHNRNNFEVFAFCWSPEDGTPFRQRVKNAFDHFYKIGSLNDNEAADLIESLEIDVLVDLHSLSGRARPGLIAQGPAPIQISYLGYPGTSAIPHLDYVFGDEFIFPNTLQPYFTESAIKLPTAFQVSDSKRQIGEIKSREHYGFNENQFVFCCFNNNYKYNEKVFQVWMEILRSTDNTILWLLDDNKWLKENLQNFAISQKINTERLRFAERIDPRDYLARFKCADLFLDTYPYNAGTTANDALFSGLPVLTLSGPTYVSRMASSLLKNLGLPELICYDLDIYKNRAIDYSRDKVIINKFKNTIEKNKSNLFETKKIVSGIEEAIIKIRKY